MHTTVTITDADRHVDYVLAVACDYRPGMRGRYGWLDGGEPGEAPAVEINAVRCLEVAVWCGDEAVSAFPAGGGRDSLESRIGRWCLEKYAEEIEQAVLETVLGAVAARREAADD